MNKKLTLWLIILFGVVSFALRAETEAVKLLRSSQCGGNNPLQPSNREELKQILYESYQAGIEDLNVLDVSCITDMSYLFNAYHKDDEIENIYKDWNPDISRWNVAKVTNMGNMFYQSGLEGKEPEWYLQ